MCLAGICSDDLVMNFANEGYSWLRWMEGVLIRNLVQEKRTEWAAQAEQPGAWAWRWHVVEEPWVREVDWIRWAN